MSSRNSLKIHDYHMNFVKKKVRLVALKKSKCPTKCIFYYSKMRLHTENLPRSPTFTLYSLILEHYQVYK